MTGKELGKKKENRTGGPSNRNPFQVDAGDHGTISRDRSGGVAIGDIDAG